MKPAAFLYSYAKPYRLKILLATVFMLASSGLNVLPPYLFKSVVDDVLISRNTLMLNIICVLVIVIFGLKAITMYLQRYYMNEAGQGVVMDIRNALYDHMMRMKLGTIYASRTGDLMSRITGDASTLQNIVTTTFIDLMFNLVTFIGMFSFIIYINWKLTCLIVIVLPFVGLLLSFAGKKLRVAGHNVQEHLADITATAQEAFSAVRVVRSFANEDEELERFRIAGKGNYDALLKAVSVQGILAGVIEVFLIFALAVVFWVGGRSVIYGDLTPGELISFTGYIAFMVQPIRSVMNSMNSLQTGIASTERICAILNIPVEDDTHGHEHIAIKGNISFRDVSFSYDTQEILHGVNIDVEAGGKIAIVGPTGSGKSTIADLIPRFYEPSSGKILIDGTDISEFGLKDLRRQIGIVPQECVLMRGSIAFNIAYGMGEIDMAKVREAAEIADISAFIESLPEGYDTLVGERGVTLSGGQRQRIAIARAVIRDPRILILDEATSSLDTASELAVQKALNQAMKGRTSIIIAHRLSTIRNADRIYVLRDGRFIEAGTHDELIAMGGLYAELYGNL
ncbi:MAG: ABC transporter ATP-binding protein [Synergistaceae bacterium]|nr:ABC transporter ATP-binding protein [Synergistaceae bacterium]MBQ6418878.1 ABC transporter ATP-binding protein [Synergistaceae bacterium]MBQ6982388.1 ABC transporter ATP-binding protein [Synergistaceae bacterium]